MNYRNLIVVLFLIVSVILIGGCEAYNINIGAGPITSISNISADGISISTNKDVYDLDTIASEFKATVRNNGNKSIYHPVGICHAPLSVYKQKIMGWGYIHNSFKYKVGPKIVEVKKGKTIDFYWNDVLGSGWDVKKGVYRIDFRYSLLKDDWSNSTTISTTFRIT